jgi:hypothetical protein
MTWFTKLTGIDEETPQQVRRELMLNVSYGQFKLAVAELVRRLGGTRSTTTPS